MKNIALSILLCTGCSEATSPEDTATSNATQDEQVDTSAPEGEEDTNTTQDTEGDISETGELVINEVSIDPVDTEDWIEFYNSTSDDVDIGEWLVGDDVSEMYSVSQLSVVSTVPSGGFLAIYTKIADDSGNEVGFGLKKDGSESLFFIREGEEDAEEITIPAPTEEGLTYGRVPDGGETWENDLTESFGDSNNP